MNLIERSTTYKTVVLYHPIIGIVLHDTETLNLATPHPQGSWHYEIDRDGQVYQYCDPEHDMAWHVAACDRWRPLWMLKSPYLVSDANYCTLGIELVSHQTYRDAGEPYTQQQYDSLNELMAYLYGRYGRLPTVGHGEMQRDRTDPVLFDWERAGFDECIEYDRYWDGADEMANQWLRDRVAALEEDQARINAIKAEFEALLRELETRRRLKRGTTDRLIAKALEAA